MIYCRWYETKDRSETTSVNLNPVSAPSQGVSVRSSEDIALAGGEPIRLTVPTVMSEEKWREALRDERVDNGGHIQGIEYVQGEPYGSLTLRMEAGVSYSLRMSKVSFGQTTERQEPHYIVNQGDDEISVREGRSERITLQVRDRLNNPVSGVGVNATLTGDGDIEPVEPTTNTDGEATFRYVPPDTGGGTAGLEFSILNNDVARERTTVGVTVIAGDGGTPETGGGLDQGEDSGVLLESVQRLSGGSSNEADVRFRNTDGSSKNITDAKLISFYDSQPNCPCGDRLRLGGTDPVLEEGGAMETLDTPITLPSGRSTSVNFDFRSSSSSGGRFSVRGEDFALIRMEFDDGTRSFYMVQFSSN